MVQNPEDGENLVVNAIKAVNSEIWLEKIYWFFNDEESKWYELLQIAKIHCFFIYFAPCLIIILIIDPL